MIIFAVLSFLLSAPMVFADCVITWDVGVSAATDNLTSYEVYISGQNCRAGLIHSGCSESLFSKGPVDTIPPDTDTTCTEQSWSPSGKTYFFVKAVNADGKSPASNLACGDFSTRGPCLYPPESAPTIVTLTFTESIP